jgi:hypothetical protein
MIPINIDFKHYPDNVFQPKKSLLKFDLGWYEN